MAKWKKESDGFRTDVACFTAQVLPHFDDEQQWAVTIEGPEWDTYQYYKRLFRASDAAKEFAEKKLLGKLNAYIKKLEKYRGKLG